MDFSIGSNRLRNANGIFTAKGQDFMHVELGKDQQELLLTMELFNPTGTSVAKLDRNQWKTNDQDRFEVSLGDEGITIQDNTLKGVIIQLTIEETHCVLIPQAKFYLPSGAVSEITKEWWRIGNKMELQGADIDLAGGAIEVQ